MKRLATSAFVAVLVAASTVANAWWGGPGWGSGWNNWWNNFFGDASFDFHMSMGAGGRGWGRGWNRWNVDQGYSPYWGAPWGYGYPYPTPVVPLAPVPAEAK